MQDEADILEQACEPAAAPPTASTQSPALASPTAAPPPRMVNNPSGRPLKTAEAFAADRTAQDTSLAEYLSRDDVFFNDSAAVIAADGKRVALKHEQPHHRMMVSLRARGYTIREIADMTGRTAATVSYTLKQPWARAMMLDLLRQDDAQLAEILRAEAMPSVEKLVEIRDDGGANRREQLAASMALLDRFLGKPTQRVETAEGKMPTDLEQLVREADSVRLETERLIGRSN